MDIDTDGDAERVEPDEVSRVVRVSDGKACAHCGNQGHSTRFCTNKVSPEKCGGRCRYCCDMAHRRQRPNCLGCDKPFEPEVVVHPIPGPGCGLGGCNV